MTQRVDLILSELASVPGALWHDNSNPMSKPQFIPTATPLVIPGALHIDVGSIEPANPTLWNETLKGAKARVEGKGGQDRSGVDALAWYRSFHSDQDRWGIYIPLSSLAIVDELYLKDLDMPRADRCKLVWDAIVLHEQMHFAVDLACAWFELLLRAPVRAEFKQRMALTNLHEQKATQAWLEIEEAAANAHMLRSLSKTYSEAAVEAVREFVRMQPAGYRDGLAAISDLSFRQVLSKTLQSHVAVWALDRGLDLGSPALDPYAIVPIYLESVIAECPIWEIDDLDASGLGGDRIKLVTRIEEVAETASFQKQLRKLDLKYQRDWKELKERIAISLPPSPRFKRFDSGKPPVYSLYLQDGHRVHLYAPSVAGGSWQAFKVGGHKDMGHG